MMSRLKHPFQALSSVDVDTLTRESLSALLSKKALANQIATANCVKKKKSSYSCHSKIVDSAGWKKCDRRRRNWDEKISP